MQNEKLIQDFLEFKNITNKSHKGEIASSTLKRYKDNLIHFSKYLNKDFKQATEKDILNYLKDYEQSSRNCLITLIRAFYRFIYNLDENEKLPECVRRIKPTRTKKDDIKYRERVITIEEYDKLLKYASQPIHKAMIETLWITGGRRNAIQSIKSNGVWYDGKFTHVILSESKTETREFIHEDRAEHLLLWVEEMQPFKDKENKPLFAVKVRGKIDEYKQVNEKYTNKVLKRLCEKIPDIKRRITPHDFRHTKCTNMLKEGIPDTHVKTLLGFTKDTDMLKVYDHNRLKDYKEWLKDRKKQTKPTYGLLEKQNKELEIRQEQIETLIRDFNALHKALLKQGIMIVCETDEKLLFPK